METIAYLKQTGKNFCKCGIAGWCLEVVFTSMESILLHDWRLIGKTSLLMFPIYGMGALLEPIGRGVDRWLSVEAGHGGGERKMSLRRYCTVGRQTEPVGRQTESVGRQTRPTGGQTEKVQLKSGQAELSAGDRMIRHGMLYMVLIFVAEYISGTWLRARGICPWDYTGRHSNINGLIRLDFAPLWFGTGLLFEQITKKKGA